MVMTMAERLVVAEIYKDQIGMDPPMPRWEQPMVRAKCYLFYYKEWNKTSREISDFWDLEDGGKLQCLSFPLQRDNNLKCMTVKTKSWTKR